jgi:hypothetical protein
MRAFSAIESIRSSYFIAKVLKVNFSICLNGETLGKCPNCGNSGMFLKTLTCGSCGKEGCEKCMDPAFSVMTWNGEKPT